MGILQPWCEKGVMRKLSKNALRVFKEIKGKSPCALFLPIQTPGIII